MMDTGSSDTWPRGLMTSLSQSRTFAFIGLALESSQKPLNNQIVEVRAFVKPYEQDNIIMVCDLMHQYNIMSAKESTSHFYF